MAYQVFVLNGYEQVAEVTEWTRVELIERDLEGGNWVLQIPAAGNGLVVSEIMLAPLLGLEIVDTATGRTTAGPNTQLRRVYDGSGLARIEMRGVDLMGVLGWRFEWPDPGDPHNWWVTSVSSQVLSTAVTNGLYFDAGPGSEAERQQIAGLEIVDPPAPFGPVKDWQASGLPLSEVWRPWFERTPWTYRLQLHRPLNLGDATARFTVRQRATAPVVVTPELHPGEIEIVETAAAATYTIGMGEEIAGRTDGARHVVVNNFAEPGWWMRPHRELLLNRPSMRATPLSNYVNQQAIANLEQRTANVTDFEVPGFGVNVEIGDLVEIVYDPNEAPLVQPIASVRLVGDENGWRRTASIGRDVPTELGWLDQRISSVARQVRAVEAEL